MAILAAHVIFGGLTIFLTFCFAVYVVAVVNHHVTPIFPFISYTGNFPVESCLFSLAFNFAATILIFTVTLRFFQVQDIMDNSSNTLEDRKKKINRHNIKCLLYGLFGSLGLNLVGSFQQRHAKPVHLTGFFLSFIFIFIYMLIQTYFSFTCLTTSRKLKFCRMAFVIGSFCIFLVAPFLFFYNLFILKKNFGSLIVYPLVEENWTRLVGAFLEWLLFFLYVAFTCTYYSDFKMIAIEKDRIVFLR